MEIQTSSAVKPSMPVRGTQTPVPKKEVTVCTNPATGEVIAEYPLHTVADVVTAVQKARRAQPAWQALPIFRNIRQR
jgi:acyl-CoA reductase-like NAD-dependent aldehyde dehydrogenase